MSKDKFNSAIEELFQKSVNDGSISSQEDASAFFTRFNVDDKYLKRRLVRDLQKKINNVGTGGTKSNTSEPLSTNLGIAKGSGDSHQKASAAITTTTKPANNDVHIDNSANLDGSRSKDGQIFSSDSGDKSDDDVIYIKTTNSQNGANNKKKRSAPYHKPARRDSGNGQGQGVKKGKGSKRQPLSKQQMKGNKGGTSGGMPDSVNTPMGVKNGGNSRPSTSRDTTQQKSKLPDQTSSTQLQSDGHTTNLAGSGKKGEDLPGGESSEEEGEVQYVKVNKQKQSKRKLNGSDDGGNRQDNPPQRRWKRLKKYPFKYVRRNAVMAGDSYLLQKVRERRYKSYTAIDTTYNVKLKQDWMGKKFSDLLDDFYKMFSSLLTQTRHQTQKVQGARNYGRVVIKHQSIQNAIVIPLMKLHYLHPGIILESIQNALNSNESLAIDNSFTITIGTIQNMSGRGRIHPTSEENLARKTSVKLIKNKDHLCFQRAIAVAWANLTTIPKKAKNLWKNLKDQVPGRTTLEKVMYLKRVPYTYYQDVMKDKRTDQLNLALALADFAGVPTDRPGGMDDILLYEEALNINIAVISREYGNKFITPKKEGRPKIYLYHNHGHFDVILTPTGFFNSSYFCDDCNQPFSDFKTHTCQKCCSVCHSTSCWFEDSAATCSRCNRLCRSKECFKRHEEKGLCEKFWECPECKKIMKTSERNPENHDCSEHQCFSCKEYVGSSHKCFMRAITPKASKLKLIVFDFECRQDEEFQCEAGFEPKNPNGEGCSECSDSLNRCTACSVCVNCLDSNCGAKLHKPNLVISQTVCDSCVGSLETDFESKCSDCGSRCSNCSDKEGGEFAKDFCQDTCGHRVKCFKGDECGQEFAKWLFTENHKDFVAMSHYGRNYDNYFILKHLLQNGIPPENVIYSGSKVMSMTVRKGMNIKFLDSFNFFPTKLSALPKTFDFTDTSKGYFPHFFNIEENWDYVGPYPDKEYYGADFMSPDEREKFLDWYSKIPRDAVFDFQKEIVEYCKIDTDILLMAAVKFREIIMKITETDSLKGLDPYQSTTLASLCMTIFKTYYLEEKWLADIIDISGQVVKQDQIVYYKGGEYRLNGEIVEEGTVKKKKFLESPLAYIPSSGYTKTDQYSAESIYYLEWLKHTRKVDIHHALNYGEKRVKIGRSWYRFDGFIPDTSGNSKGHVIEYHGCQVHGCTLCYTTNRKSTRSPFTNETIEQLYQKTMRKRRDLLVHGYTYECIWGCKYHEMLKENQKFRKFVERMKDINFVTPRLDPKDAFYGGRVDTSKLFYEVQEDEQIHYYDVTSLYPFVNKYAEYPKGHPEIITSDFKDLKEYFGIAKIDILPPESLYHPVLPVRSNGKLKFPLCGKCAEEENQSLCQCTPHERCLRGTWSILEINKAVEKGYKIQHIYEVYHWSETLQYNPETGENGLFSEYVNAVLKIKQESSGYPDECENNPEKEEKYIQDYFEHENIHLNPDNIEKNPGLRSVAKLLANSLWGKFVQRPNLKQTKFITENECNKFVQFMTDPSIDISNFHIVTDKVIQLEYTHKDGFVPESVSTNIFVGIFTTAHARLELYKILDFLDGNAERTVPVGDNQVIEGLLPSAKAPLASPLTPARSYPTRVLYYDTDSVIFTTHKGQENPPLGNYLGQLTDEVPNKEIVRFISAGPKVYAYRTRDGVDVCKIRGFTLNFRNESVINLESLEKIVKGWNTPMPPLVTANPSKIGRDKQTCSILSKLEEKRFKMVYTKRVIKPDYDTVPYGYK